MCVCEREREREGDLDVELVRQAHQVVLAEVQRRLRAQRTLDRGTSLVRNCLLLGRYSRATSRALMGGCCFL